MKVHNLPKVVTKNDFPRLGVEPGSLDPKANTLPTELSRPRFVPNCLLESPRALVQY